MSWVGAADGYGRRWDNNTTALARVRIWLHSIHMTSPQVSQVNDEPDYTKVRGWLLAFGIYAGFTFLLAVTQLLFAPDAQRELYQRLPATAAKVVVGSAYVGYFMSLVYLAQCVCILLRLRVGRTLSLVASGWKIIHCLVLLPFMGALIDATKEASVPPGVDPAGYVKSVSAVITFSAYFGTFLSLAFAVASFLYFLRSERVKQTLVN